MSCCPRLKSISTPSRCDPSRPGPSITVFWLGPTEPGRSFLGERTPRSGETPAVNRHQPRFNRLPRPPGPRAWGAGKRGSRPPGRACAILVVVVGRGVVARDRRLVGFGGAEGGDATADAEQAGRAGLARRGRSALAAGAGRSVPADARLLNHSPRLRFAAYAEELGLAAGIAFDSSAVFAPIFLHHDSRRAHIPAPREGPCPFPGLQVMVV